MPSAVSTVDGNQSVEELRRELGEAREQQAATAEILKVISRSPTDLQRVFAEIAASAAQLCDAYDASIFQLNDNRLCLVAHHGAIPQSDTLPLTRGFITGRVVLDQQTIHIADIQAEAGEYPEGRSRALHLGHRTILAVPLMREGEAIGAIAVRRTEVRRFTDRQTELLKTFANQAVIAIENTRLFEHEQVSKRELQESLEYQTATSEVLNVISRSPTELQPVLDTIAATAARLCESMDALVWRVAGGRIRVVAEFGSPTNTPDHPLTRGSVTGRAIVDRKTIHVHDLAAMVETEYPDVKEIQQRIGHRTTLATPLVSQGEALGAISVRKNHVHPFSDRQIALLQTFADQAVIAIENARLFEEVQTRTRELTEALEYQTATTDVLNVISRSKFDLQPVLDSIVQTAARLCACDMATIRRREGDVYVQLAGYGLPDDYAEYSRSASWHHAGRGSLVGRVLQEGKAVQIPDVLADPDYTLSEAQRRGGFRSTLGVPLLRGADQIGIIVLMRRAVQPFSDKQIELVTAFADQAVIAIENTRLFEAEQSRTRELREALERQTATAEVLSVISSSHGVLEPVFQAMLANAVRICEAKFGVLFRHDHGAFRQLASVGVPSEYAEYMRQRDDWFRPVGSLNRLLQSNDIVQTEDALAEFVQGPAAKYGGARSLLAMPMFKENELVGAIIIYRQEVRPFSDKQIELVKGFASQAVIAIENTRLLNELRESLQQQTATAEVLKAISRSALDLQAVLNALVSSASELCDAPMVAIHVERNGMLPGRARHGFSPDVVMALSKVGQVMGRGSLAGRTISERKPVHIPNVEEDSEYAFHDFTRITGARTMLGIPLVRDGTPIGLLSLYRTRMVPFTARQTELMATFADQAVIAIENVRLFDEIAQKSHELEIASQHKSQFVANMSHELRTPLAAILGYAELMQEGFYEPLGQKSLDALTRIRSNGKHLLGLINTVLDIAKIESGQFTLNMAEYAIESVVETVRSATESLAQNKKLALKTDVAKSLPIGLGDEQRLTQVLLNLVGNAIKFTDTGEIRVTAKSVNGHFTVSVTDTGPGIPEEHQARIFEQFHQVDSSNTKAKGGTGLGLAIAKQIVEMHGGRIWVESTPGKGSTFQMELPTRAEFQKAGP